MGKSEKNMGDNEKIKNQVLYLTQPPFLYVPNLI